MTSVTAWMSELSRVLPLVTIAAVWLYVPYGYWKIYRVYKLLGDRTGNLGFLWFSFQFQHPTFSRGMKSYVDYYGTLPNDLKAQVDATRSQLRRHVLTMLLWILFVVAFGLLAGLLERHHS